MAQAKAIGGKGKKAAQSDSLLGELVSFRIFKPNSGRVVRQVTAVTVAALLIACAIRAYQLMDANDWSDGATFAVPLAITIGGIWFAFRLVNWPRFASFLIDVETEMQKVSWASWDYLVRATIVVVAVMFIIGAALFGFDLVWKTLFELLGFIDSSALTPEATEVLPGAGGAASN